jgi:hypothetical protein
VTGTTRLSSSQTCVMPTFSPTIALVAMGCASFCGLSRERSARESPAERVYRLCRTVPGDAGLHGRQLGQDMPCASRAAALRRAK